MEANSTLLQVAKFRCRSAANKFCTVTVLSFVFVHGGRVELVLPIFNAAQKCLKHLTEGLQTRIVNDSIDTLTLTTAICYPESPSSNEIN